MKAFFITGTDTGIGKTYVTCQLLDYFHAAQQKAFAIKPVATGSSTMALNLSMSAADLINEDLQQIQRHNPKTRETLTWPINGWQFATPVSPHIAAKEAGYGLTAKAIAEFCQDSRYRSLDALLIEGAGGLCVPINEQETWLDVLNFLECPVILVVGIRLGCINHAMLSAHMLQSSSTRCLGWIANCLDPDMLALEENIQTLTRMLQVPCLGRTDFNGRLQVLQPFY
ncbi:MAG: dethiobiotin synthase [Legionella sp.]|nr:dethiobiotin synthase [Legionella sp.]